jgi:hypothetical protein
VSHHQGKHSPTARTGLPGCPHGQQMGSKPYSLIPLPAGPCASRATQQAAQYHARITRGTHLRLHQAARCGVQLTANA